MPPVMGIAAFVMAELLGVPYARIAIAGVIPAAVAITSRCTLSSTSRREDRGIGTLRESDLAGIEPIARAATCSAAAGR